MKLMACIKIIFFLTVLFSLTTSHSQTIDDLIEYSYDLDAIAQYQLGMLFYGVSLAQETHPKAKIFKAHYRANYAVNPMPLEPLDSLDIQFYKDWLQSNYLDNIKRSAKKGHAKAQLQLGKYYETSDEHGAKIRAYKWYASSAEQDNIEAINWINQKNEELYLKQYLKPEDYKDIDFYVSLINLSETLCYYANDGPNGMTLDERIETKLLEFLDITKEDADYKTKLVDFWNSYNKFFICFDNDSDIPEHILKRSLSELAFLNDQVLFIWLFDLNQTKAIDFNQVIYFDGQPETILDFLNTILLNRYDYQGFSPITISELRTKLIEDCDAKTASELKD
jgi:hypothetical protein